VKVALALPIALNYSEARLIAGGLFLLTPSLLKENCYVCSHA